MANVLCWLVAILCLCDRDTMGQKTPDPCPESAIRLPVARENSTCGFKSGRVEICNDGVWKTICDSDWTRNDAAVACRQLGYSTIGAEVSPVSLTINLASTVPECVGTENNLTQCPSISSTTVYSVCEEDTGVICFLNDSAPDICFGVPTTPPTDTQAITIQATTNQAITSQAITNQDNTTNQENRPEQQSVLHPVVSHLLAVLGGAVIVLVPVTIIAFVVKRRSTTNNITIATTDDITIATTNDITLSDNTAYTCTHKQDSEAVTKDITLSANAAYSTHKQVSEDMYETIT
ncbi:putative DMBT1-like protein [Halichondria panicea]|uniref:putative DMBT1-like protein n=1 Tax=Halichondria panicea TaxID=6063 RepID=UPI00312B80F1